MRPKFYFSVLLMWTLLLGCNEPEARKPITVASGSFLKASIETSKQILNKDLAAIQSYVSALDSVEVFTSHYGFSYFYEVARPEDTLLPKPGDEVHFTYSVQSLQNETIYDTTEIGSIRYVVDREKLFEGLREAIKLMKKGEVATFLFPSALAYGSLGDKKRIAPNQPLVCSIYMLDHSPLAATE
ncbi:MAG: gliding motility-associated peptidyl-prolyl isomerase GldI [Flavobacteriaceae bacterium]|nr:gliding motility-associated peptidyl-prolyl isomerase GldI [Flavobacteriaceae bacterium]